MARSQPQPTAQIRERREYEGATFLKQGFWPFFLGAGIWSALAMALWLGFLFDADALPLFGHMLSGLAWVAAFSLFSILYYPFFTKP